MILQWHAMARSDIEKAFVWYKKRSVPAASRLLEQVDAAAKRAHASPQIFPRTVMGCRKVLVKRYPYSLIFQWRSDSITIVAVAHAKRRSSYWHGRVTPGSIGSDLL